MRMCSIEVSGSTFWAVITGQCKLPPGVHVHSAKGSPHLNVSEQSETLTLVRLVGNGLPEWCEVAEGAIPLTVRFSLGPDNALIIG